MRHRRYDAPAGNPVTRTYIVIDGISFDTTTQFRWLGTPLCPDHLEHADLGAADNLRGRVIRGFFWLLRVWRP